MVTMLSVDDLQSVMIHYPNPDAKRLLLDNSTFIDYPLCRRCTLGRNYGELIRPCQCTGRMEFIHVHCLEATANLNNTFHCAMCYHPFPVEIRNKPLLEWCRNTDALFNMLQEVCCFLLKMLGLILFEVSLAVLAGYLITVLDITKIAKFIPLVFVIIILLSVLFLGIPEWMRIMIDLCTRFRDAWRKWQGSNQEMKLIKGYSIRRFVS